MLKLIGIENRCMKVSVEQHFCEYRILNLAGFETPIFNRSALGVIFSNEAKKGTLQLM